MLADLWAWAFALGSRVHFALPENPGRKIARYGVKTFDRAPLVPIAQDCILTKGKNGTIVYANQPTVEKFQLSASLDFPICALRADHARLLKDSETTKDAQFKASSLFRARECEFALRILELYATFDSSPVAAE